MAQSVEIQFMRYERLVRKVTVVLHPSTTCGSLVDMFNKEFPAGLVFVSETGQRLPKEWVPEAGKPLIGIASDRSQYLREAVEKAASSYSRMVGQGRKRRRDGDQSRWFIIVAPQSGVSDDGRFHSAGEPNHYWVLWRESFDQLEMQLVNLFFSPTPERRQVLLCGPAGTGKSHAVLAMVHGLMRRAHEAAEDSRGSSKERYRVVPILDCQELSQDFETAVMKGLATGFGDDEAALDELCQLEKEEEFKGFVRRHSKVALFVLDQYQFVEFDRALKMRVEKLVSEQRVLFVTSAGSDDVKELITKAHKYKKRLEIPPALSEVSDQQPGGIM
jgi:hypothetical protein